MYIEFKNDTDYDDYCFEEQLFEEELIFQLNTIEHLENPWHFLREVSRVLKDGGKLILTTPNVNRLENVSKMLAGANIYDPFSGYGPYGRHNREYNKHELFLLLSHVGFEIEIMFSSDVFKVNSAKVTISSEGERRKIIL